MSLLLDPDIMLTDLREMEKERACARTHEYMQGLGRGTTWAFGLNPKLWALWVQPQG